LQAAVADDLRTDSGQALAQAVPGAGGPEPLV